MLTFSGSAFERGQQHGEARRDAIEARVIASVLEPTRAASGSGRLERLAEPWWRRINEVAPDIAGELRGIGLGSRRPLAEVILLNAFEAFDLADQTELGGCTSVAVPGVDGAIVGQNWDANPALAATVEVHHHVVSGGPDVVVLASPGGLGWIGMNATGLALTTTDLLTRSTAPGVPSQVARRLVLGQTDVSGAIELLNNLAIVGGRAYIIGDSHGTVATLELAAELVAPCVIASGGPAAHTNHALSPDVARFEETELLDRTYPSTHARLESVVNAISERPPSSIDDVRELLTGHAASASSICRHAPSVEPTVTAASAIFDCGRHVAHIAVGNPCDEPFVSVAV